MDKGRMRPALMLLVGCQEGHLGHKQCVPEQVKDETEG